MRLVFAERDLFTVHGRDDELEVADTHERVAAPAELADGFEDRVDWERLGRPESRLLGGAHVRHVG